jgi:cytochrome c5
MSRARSILALALGAAGLVALATCRSSDRDASAHAAQGATPWDTIYGVLQHPRCMNCHPAGDRPLQGDDSHPHVQNVRRGPDGQGLFALRCDACHQTANPDDPHLPPGAPGWRLPTPSEPLIFEGRSSGDLCRQLRDARRNGGKSPAELEHHMLHDALVLWGWSPGAGRAPVATPQAAFAAAVQAWVASGCDCPD